MYTSGFVAVIIGGIFSGSGLLTLLASLPMSESVATTIGAVLLIIGIILTMSGAVIMTYPNVKESANEDVQVEDLQTTLFSHTKYILKDLKENINMMASPEVHNIIARWNKESGHKSNIGLKVERIQDKDF